MARPDSVSASEPMPSQFDVVIIGGGIAGLSTALELAERGLQVAVCEKGVVAGEQSGRDWGWCRQTGRDPRELPLIRVSMELWRQMHRRTGEDVGFRQCGIAYLCETERKLARRQQWQEKYAGQFDLNTRVMTPAEARRRAPGAHVKWKGGLFTPDDGRAEPGLAVPAMARAAQRAGVSVLQNCAVRGLVRQAGQLSGVVTEQGEFSCDVAVLAGGAWSRRFCHNEGIALPQLSVINSVARTAALDAGIEPNVSAADFAIRKRLDGGYTVAHSRLSTADVMPDSFRLLPQFLPLLKDEWRDFRYRLGQRFVEEARLKRRWNGDEKSPFEIVRMLNPEPDRMTLEVALGSLRDTFPVFRDIALQESWAGVIDVMPDAVPVLSGVDRIGGFFLATGFSGHGFGLGPGAGKLMAQLICGEVPCVDPQVFSLGRFQ